MRADLYSDRNTGCVDVVAAITLCLIIGITIIGNVIVVVAVICNRVLHTVSNIFILSLSLADLLVGTIVMIPAMLNEVFGQWILEEKFCSVWVSFDVMLTSSSVLNVCLISLDRYMIILHPLRYKSLMTSYRALALLAGVWTVAIMVSFLPIENGWHFDEKATLENLTLFSTIPQCFFVVSLPYAVTVSTLTILLPLLVSFMLYYRISREAARQRCLLRMLATPGNVLMGMRKMPWKTIREPFTRKATCTLGVIVGAYVITWAPFLTSNIIEVFCRCVPAQVFRIFVWLGYCNSLINPIIYPLFMRDFRKVYFKFILLRFPFLKRCKRHRNNVNPIFL